MNISKTATQFYLVLSLIISLIVTIRFGSMMLNNKKEEETSHYNSPRYVRGEILDRNGRLLATQIKLQSLEAEPWGLGVTNPKKASKIIGSILDMDEEELYQKFTKHHHPYFWIKRFIPEEQSNQLLKLIHSGKFPGFRLIPEFKRFYPEGELASHVIGFTNIDNKGLDGIELSMDSWLSPTPIKNREAPPVIYGHKVYLSLDIQTQYIIDKLARENFLKNKPDHLIAMLMDAHSGDILSYISLPEYNPNYFNLYTNKQRQNWPLTIAFEPGSVFKIFSMASFLDYGNIQVNQTFDIGTVYNPDTFIKYNIKPIHDVTPHHSLTTTELLIYSSNVGMATAAETIPIPELYNKFEEFGFGSPTGLQLPGESHGILKSPKAWSIRTKPTIVFGQEIGVSAVQMITASTVFTNGGVLLAPHIIKQVVSVDKQTLMETSRKPVREVLKPNVARSMLLMMEQAVSSPLSTMRGAQIEGLRISGKSGTAQIINPKTGEYYKDNVIGSVIAIFPTNNPQFILYIALVNPKGQNRYGGHIASPLVKSVIQELTNRYNIPLDGNKIAHHSGRIKKSSLAAPIARIKDGILPSLIGYSKKGLREIFNDKYIYLVFHGDGHVVAQNPPAGTKLPYHKKVTIQVTLK